MRSWPGVLVLTAAAILAYQLLLPPTVGLANNGDFGKTFGVFNLTGPMQDEFRFADLRYEFNPRKYYWAEFYSSEQLLVPLAIGLNTVLSKDGFFDLRAMGVIHALLLLAALYLLMTLLADAHPAVRTVTALAALFVFSDVMYASYLNSFYMDTAACLFVLLAAVLYVRVFRWHRHADAVLLAVCSLMLITSKAQHAPLGIWMAVLFFTTRSLIWPKKGKPAVVIALGLALVAGLWLWKSSPPAYGLRACFSVIFTQVLPHSKNVDRAISDLGLDSSYRPYIGMHAFVEGSPMNSPEFVERFGRAVSHGSLARFFLTHPRDAYVALRTSLDEVGRQRPYQGNFDVASGLPPMSESRAFAFWSNWKRALFHHHGQRYFFTFLALAGVLAALIAVQRRALPAGAPPGAAILIAMALTELAVSSLGDALDATRHHLVFFALFDMMVIASIYLGARLCLFTFSRQALDARRTRPAAPVC